MIILILFASVLPYVNLDKSFSSRLVLGKWIIPTLGTMLAIEYTVYWHNNGKIKDIINNYYYFDTAKAIKPFGMYGFYLWNISQLISNTQYDYKELNQVEAFLKSLHSSCNRIESENKNVIVLIVESLETWPIFAKYGNTEVAPNLNKIIKQGMFFPLVKTQVKGGMSSDCQLIINTGLLPINEGAVFFKYAHNKFLTLADALKLNKKIYSSAVIIGDEPTYWNQKIMTYRLGYDCFFSSSELDNNDIVGMGISDSSVLAQSVNIIKSMKQPFLVQIITLSSHMPFKIPIEKIKIVLPDSIDTQTRNYLEAINYTDYCIG
ncbi:MAG: LTA synthase family protein, partial [Bacteroidales bacterium]|nr:LTA synthase family protein [Bacteroidales bacterium]